ncbi:MAG: isoprenylcysteine carboxylmethyltransferase family protein [Desulfomonilaceae bacterium]
MKEIVKQSVKSISSRNKLCRILVGAFFVVFIVPTLLLLVSGKIEAYLVTERFLVSKAMLGLLSLASGILLLIWTVLPRFMTEKETPVLLVSTQKLIVQGPYKICRNPMLLGAIIYYFGVGTLWRSITTGLIMLFLGLIIGTVYNKYIKERKLTEQFGEEYQAYKSKTPFLIPMMNSGPRQVKNGNPYPVFMVLLTFGLVWIGYAQKEVYEGQTRLQDINTKIVLAQNTPQIQVFFELQNPWDAGWSDESWDAGWSKDIGKANPEKRKIEKRKEAVIQKNYTNIVVRCHGLCQGEIKVCPVLTMIVSEDEGRRLIELALTDKFFTYQPVRVGIGTTCVPIEPAAMDRFDDIRLKINEILATKSGKRVNTSIEIRVDLKIVYKDIYGEKNSEERSPEHTEYWTRPPLEEKKIQTYNGWNQFVEGGRDHILAVPGFLHHEDLVQNGMSIGLVQSDDDIAKVVVDKIYSGGISF